jgi:hypothetical protein
MHRGLVKLMIGCVRKSVERVSYCVEGVWKGEPRE